ncbi:hypothetical protein JD844_017345 [Phrynosoma platyrhinos]|uniref:Laminin IV type A domain-containing protein n=1 Tax=Phrynosoma platyrhinos TaxID=52577 RepID=A0ABQ7SLU7_PHRPL|nr:hypothetical protein JD844_017345 [Phrynosoma platyrhinos]
MRSALLGMAAVANPAYVRSGAWNASVMPEPDPCDCNGKSRQCMFDIELLRRTGNGYLCLNCIDNTEGANCERCKEGFYRQHDHNSCVACNCNPTGFPGVIVIQLEAQASVCQGTAFVRQQSQEISATGILLSFTYEVRQSCKQGYYNLDTRNPEGCSQCFCSGHSAKCTSATNYSVHKITSSFQQGDEGWQAQGNGSPLPLQWSSHHKVVYVAARRSDPIYFVAPVKFLGNQQLSYGQTLSFDYRVNRPGRRPSQHDIVLEGAGLKITTPLMPNGRMLSCRASQTYTFRLDEHPNSNWSPRLSRTEYHSLIGNLTALRIRATYGDTTGYLSNVILISAQPTSGTPAPWVEQCVCPAGYQGQFCEKCAPGYKRENSGRHGALSNCVESVILEMKTWSPYMLPVQLTFTDPHGTHRAASHAHAKVAMAVRSSRAQGKLFAIGAFQALMKLTEDSCFKSHSTLREGVRCEFCISGYFGDPLGEQGPVQPCQPCQCENVDPNASWMCNQLTGECYCKDGFFGNPLSPNPAEKCQGAEKCLDPDLACNCSPVGALEPMQCQRDGSCICKPGFEGRNCEQHPHCPACYSRVKTQVDQYLQKLQGLEMLVHQIKTSGNQGDNAELERKMREAEEMLQQVLREVQSLQASDRALGSRLSKMKTQGLTYQSRLDEINETTNRLQSLGRQYQSQVQDARRLVERARVDLEQSKAQMGSVANIIDLRGNCVATQKQSICSITEDQKIIPSPDIPGSSNSFLILAQEAMKLANSHMQLANTIEQASWAAEDATQQALALLQSSASGESILANSAHGLRKKYDEVKLLSSELEADAGKAASDADRIYQSSQLLLGSLARLPKVDTNFFQEEASQLRQKADSLSGLVETYMAEYKQLQGNIQNWEAEMKELLQKGQNDRLVSVQLLSRANLAKSKARQALSAGNVTFDEVESILKNLREFNLQVGDRQAEAKDAMQRLPLISSMIASANEKTRRAEAALGTAVTEAGTARRMAGEAKEIAGGIDQEITRLALEANRTADGVLALEQGIFSLQNEAKDMESELQKKALEVDMDATMVQETLQMSQRAKADAGNAGRAVQDMLSALEDILRMMDQPEAMDEQGVNLLEMNLSKTRVRHSQLKELMFQMEQTASRQKRKIETLERSITEILADIKNLEDIRDNLPPKCYNVQPIERP